MQSIGFPNMFENTYTNTLVDYDAILSNLKMLLYSDKGSLLGDPYYGTNLKRMLFAQNDSVLKDNIIDDIYTAICIFMPEIKITRNDIEVYQDKSGVTVLLTSLYLVDYNTNLYNIKLTFEE